MFCFYQQRNKCNATVNVAISSTRHKAFLFANAQKEILATWHDCIKARGDNAFRNYDGNTHTVVNMGAEQKLLPFYRNAAPLPHAANCSYPFVSSTSPNTCILSLLGHLLSCTEMLDVGMSFSVHAPLPTACEGRAYIFRHMQCQ